MLSWRPAPSPCASTAIDRVRSPFVTAVATSAMARTWPGRVAARRRSSVVRTGRRRGGAPGPPVAGAGEAAPRAGGAGHARLPAELAFDADLARHVGHLVGERGER